MTELTSELEEPVQVYKVVQERPRPERARPFHWELPTAGGRDPSRGARKSGAWRGLLSTIWCYNGIEQSTTSVDPRMYLAVGAAHMKRPSYSLSRRLFIERAGTLVLTTAAFGLSGCGSSFDSAALPGGGGGGSNPPPMVTGNFSGQANLGEVSGSGLQVVSIYAAPSPVAASGSFATDVSTEGAQLLMLRDADRRLRGLALSVPQPDGSLASLPIGAESTALSLAFVVRGILTVIPAEVEARLASIRALASFAPFQQFVASRLVQEDLGTTAARPDYQALLQAVVLEYLQQPAVAARAIPPTPAHPTRTGNISLRYKDADPTPLSHLELINVGWRFVALYHQDLDALGNEVPPLKVPVIEGVTNPSSNRNLLPSASGATWGGIFTGQSMAPTAGFERLTLNDRPQVKKIRYFVYGPGSGGQTTFPASVESQLNGDPFGMTFFYFGFLPLLDLVAGTVRGLGATAESVLNTYSTIAGQGVNADGVRQSYETGDQTSILAAVADFLAGVLGLVGSGLVLGATGPLAAGGAVLAAAVGASAVLFSGTNLLAAVLTTLVTPRRAEVSIAAPGAAPAYDFRSLGDPQAQSIVGVAVNGLGHVLYYETDPGSMTGPGASRLLLDRDGVSSLVAPVAPLLDRGDVNDEDDVAYSALGDGDDESVGYLKSAGQPVDLGNLGGVNPFTGAPATYAIALNKDRVVVGSSRAAGDDAFRTFRWEGGQMSRVPVPGLPQNAMDINNPGQIVTIQEIEQQQGGGRVLFLVEAEAITQIDDENLNPRGLAINDLGQVVYNKFVDNESLEPERTAFLWERGVGAQRLPRPDFISSEALGINNAGDVVGEVLVEGRLLDVGGAVVNPPTGVLWRDGTVYELNDLVPAGTPDISSAVAVGGMGHILVVVRNSNGSGLGLLTPREISST